MRAEDMLERMRDVLRYRKDCRTSRGTVRRHYLLWRESQGIPIRCDNESCVFNSQPLVWNGEPLKLILDHANGNNSDNRTKNLRLLCPNCDSQLTETRGGANKGRVEKAKGGFALVSKPDGKRNHVMPAESGSYKISGQPSNVTRTRVLPADSDTHRVSGSDKVEDIKKE